MSEPILEAKNIRKRYRLPHKAIDVLNGIDLAVNRGEWICFVGASGCGKTTLLRILGLLDHPDEGTLAYDGEDVLKFGEFASARLRRSKVGFVFQSYQLLPELDALENVMLPGLLNGDRLKPLQQRAQLLLDSFGIGDRLYHRPTELSGGEQQRVAIARAMMNEPDLIFADEPTGNLDEDTGQEIMQILSKVRTESSSTIIMVTHNHDIANYADVTYTLQDGLLQAGRTSD